MNSGGVPNKVRQKLDELKVQFEISYFFVSSSAGKNVTGESYLLFSKNHLVCFVQPIVSDLELVKHCLLRDVRKVEIEHTFLGETRIVFLGNSETLFEFDVSSLQQYDLPELMEELEKRFMGKIHERESGTLKIGSGHLQAPYQLPAIPKMGNSWGETSGVNVDVVTMGTDYDATLAQMAASAGETRVTTSTGPREVSQVSLSQKMGPATHVTVGENYSSTQPGDESSVFDLDKPVEARTRTEKKGGKTPKLNLGTRTKDAQAAKSQLPAPTTYPDESREEKGIRCSGCGRQNKPDYQYCLGCGAQLPRPVESRSSSKKALTQVYGASAAGQEDESSLPGCIGQIFFFVVFLFVLQAALRAIFG